LRKLDLRWNRIERLPAAFDTLVARGCQVYL